MSSGRSFMRGTMTDTRWWLRLLRDVRLIKTKVSLPTTLTLFCALSSSMATGLCVSATRTVCPSGRASGATRTRKAGQMRPRQLWTTKTWRTTVCAGFHGSIFAAISTRSMSASC
eukprot:Amastigsp_a842664_10.p5 type:complete len:115 gc:universal Amastigsp_a842664_10:931-587(-)